MAPVERESLRLAFPVVILAFMTVVLWIPHRGYGQEEPPLQAQSYLGRAADLDHQGRHEEALALLREARSRFASSDLLPEILLQSSRVAAAQGDEFRARYFRTEILRVAPLSAAAVEAAGALGDLLMEDHLYVDALAAYRQALAALERNPAADPEDGRALYLKAAEVAALHLGDRDSAREYLGRVDQSRLGPDQRALHAMLASRASWESMPTSVFGLEDPNVSALAADADDLWVGTWSGGLARYSWSDGSSTVFRQGEDSLVANTCRTICVTSRHVWVGTDQGLSQYSKALSAWRTVEELGGARPRKVQSVREIGGVVYVATLGDGLWALRGEAWGRIAAGALPTSYITCLGASERGLLVGTMDRGLLVLDDDGSAREADRAPAALRPRNITAVLEDSRGRIWVATYGEGLWLWDRDGSVKHFGTASGELADDWVMCVAETKRGLYAGTFGGGVSLVGRDGTWVRFGLEDGLDVLDVMAALDTRHGVAFGTLGGGVSILHEEMSP